VRSVHFASMKRARRAELPRSDAVTFTRRSRWGAVSKEALMEAAWPDLAVEESNLTFRLRRCAECFARSLVVSAGSRHCRAAATGS